VSAATTRARVPHAGILALLAVAEFMLTLDLSIVNVALPPIRDDLGFSQGSLPWVVNAYALTFGGFLLLGGRAADVFGGRRVFMGALVGFSAASLGCGLAGGQGALVAARAVQGLCAGVLAPATLSILTATYADPAARNRALSVWTAVAIGGGAVGGLAGGLLTDALGWRWIFFVNVPVGAVLVAAAIARLPSRDAGAAGRSLDVAGAVTVTAGLTALVWALIHAEAAGWASLDVAGSLAAAAVLLALFALVETRARAPLVPFSAFRSRLLSAGNLMSFLSFLPVMATWFLLTLYLQRVRGFSPTEAGLVFLPMSLAVIGGSQVSFRIIARADARLLLAGGGLLAAAGMTWLGQLSADTSPAWVLVPACVAMAGGGLMFAPVTVAATVGAAAGEGGLASGLLNTTRQIGGALGLAVLGTVAAATTGTSEAAGGLSAGYAAAFTAGAVIYVVTAAVGALALPARLSPPPSSPRAATRARPRPREAMTRSERAPSTARARRASRRCS
jgi:EmrB/QacA subfamily drug resistance transporter